MLDVSFDPFPILTTENLVLREIVPADAADILTLRSDKKAMEFIPRPIMSTEAEAHEFIALLDMLRKKNEAINWAVTLAGENRMIGNICLLRMQKENYRSEVGYMLSPDHWRKGILSETLDAVLHYGFNTVKFNSIEAIVRPDNIPSSKLLEKLSFVKEAHFKENFFYNGAFEDSVVYSMLARDYNS